MNTHSNRILIVDDDNDDREIMKEAFKATNPEHDFLFLDSGDKLVDYLEYNVVNSLPSLILLDLNMPGKDGRETLKEIKSDKRYHHIPVVVFTTSSADRDKKTVYELGANCFITKPDTFNKLTEMAECITRLWLQ